jgi:phytoene dehydrogenase-like protein
MRYDAIVIGAGINGLVAGATLARKGRKVCVLERADQPGGMARMAQTLYNLSPAVRREIGLDPHKWPFRLDPLPTVALSSTGQHIVIRGRDATFADGTAHPDADAYRALVKQLTGFGEVLRNLAEAAPPGFDAPLTSAASLKQLWRLGRTGLAIKRMDKRDLRRFLHILLSNAFDLILDEMPEGLLAGALAADSVRGAAMGPRSPGTVFSLIYRLGHGGDVTLPQGGMSTVIDSFAEAARKAGCEIRTDTSAARILMQGDMVTGVQTETGETLEAPLVLHSSGALAAAQLAGTEHFDIEATRRLRKIRARGTVARITLTLKDGFAIPGLPADIGPVRLIHAPSAEYVERAFNPSKYKHMSDAPVIEAVMPDANTLTILMQYAPVDLDGGWTVVARDKLLNIVTKTLAQSAPTLPDHIAASQVMTPDQMETATGAPGGHWHHAEMNLDQLLTIRPAGGIARYALGPKGLYLCGASAHPGGDVMGLAGRNAALKALEDMA